jgi:hypothetical protein
MASSEKPDTARTVSKSIEESALVLWGLARDLAADATKGTALNSQRAIKQLVEVIEAMAWRYALDMAVVAEASKNEVLRAKVVELGAHVTALRQAVKVADARVKALEARTPGRRSKLHSGLLEKAGGQHEQQPGT